MDPVLHILEVLWPDLAQNLPIIAPFLLQTRIALRQRFLEGELPAEEVELELERLEASRRLEVHTQAYESARAQLERIEDLVQKTLMLVTALTPVIGYDNAAKVAKKAYSEGISLKEAAVALGLLSAEEFDKLVEGG